MVLPNKFVKDMALVAGATTGVMTVIHLIRLLGHVKLNVKARKIELRHRESIPSAKELISDKIIPQTVFVYLQILCINLVMSASLADKRVSKLGFFVGASVAYIFSKLFKYRIPLPISLYITARIGVL